MYPQPDLVWTPANSANFMVGRNGTPVRYITFHHAVGPATYVVSKAQSNVQFSAHFAPASDRIYCMVDTDNTSYCNNNWASNLESVTIEHEGDWRNGFRSQGVIDQSANLVAWLRSLYPGIQYQRHNQVSSTACPCDLPVEEIWNKASDLLNPPKPVPTTPEWLQNRTPNATVMYANKGNIQLWKLDAANTPADARLFPLNQEFSIGSKTTVNGAVYYITQYSTDKNVAAGYRAEDLSPTKYVAPVQPPTPPTPTPPPAPLPAPTDYDKIQDDKINKLTAMIQTVWDYLSRYKLFQKFIKKDK